MNDYRRIPTSAEVAAVIRARHGIELVPFASFTDPCGTANGGPGDRGVMETAYGIRGTDFPILYLRTEWEIAPNKPISISGQIHSYWLCIAKAEE